jgi:hypothetical protein
MKSAWAWLAVCCLLLLLVYAVAERCESNRLEVMKLREDVSKLQKLVADDGKVAAFARAIKGSGYEIKKKQTDD